MLADDYRLLDLFSTMMIWSLWIACVVVLFRVIAGIFRSHDLGGGAKALWRSHVKDAASSGSAGTADELAELADLKAQGIITEAEFAPQKAKLLA